MAIQITDDLVVSIIVLILAAFIPSIIYMVWIRNIERYNRNPWSRMAYAFLYGAFISISIAIIFELIISVFFNTRLVREYEFLKSPTARSVVFACVVAPFVEEFAKAMGVWKMRRYIDELEDGLVYGAAVGLGFAATENLFYEGSALFTEGVEVFVVVVIIRSLFSAVLHGSATAITGFGVGKWAMERNGAYLLPSYLFAVFIHAVFNFFAFFGILYADELGEGAYLIGLFAAAILAIITIESVRNRIEHYDKR